MDIDTLDYKSVRDFKDESIKDFIHETKVMKQVKDAGAKNINEFIEAISIHSQLWLVCEYCPGGSVKTLVRPDTPRYSLCSFISLLRLRSHCTLTGI
jgi:serine/threonine protein kinase